MANLLQFQQKFPEVLNIVKIIAEKLLKNAKGTLKGDFLRIGEGIHRETPD